MPKHQAPKGTRDLWPEDCARFRRVEDAAREVARLYGYQEIRTPAFEDLALFSRAVGEATDIVEKEMWTVGAKGSKDTFALRPENTAGVVRAYLEKKLHKSAPFQRLWYLGPQFRHERKQKGRWREFTQFGVEVIGKKAPSKIDTQVAKFEGSPELDAEVIGLGMEILNRVGISNASVRINYIGTTEQRARYREKLRKYLEPKRNDLCNDCQRRFDQNVLRLLDCKNAKCREVMKGAGSISDRDFLEEASYLYFSQVCSGLEKQHVKFEHDKNLVRGLDYYTGTVFEYYVEGAEGQQDALGGGGRYDGLVEMLGGPATPAVGLALGIDRIAELVTPGDLGVDAFVVSDAEKWVSVCVNELRANKVSAAYDYEGRGFGAQMKQANKLGARTAVIVGEDERAADEVSIKNMDTGEQTRVKRDDLVSEVRRILGKGDA